MLILGLRTDKPEAEIYLFDDDKEIGSLRWEAHRQLAETLHHKIALLLSEYSYKWVDVEGIVCYKGPGSFTGLRIGLSVGNALAASLPAAIVGTTEDGWLKAGVDALLGGTNESLLSPDYGAPVHITQQRK